MVTKCPMIVKKRLAMENDRMLRIFTLGCGPTRQLRWRMGYPIRTKLLDMRRALLVLDARAVDLVDEHSCGI